MDELTLLDWKRRVFALYAEVRAEHDPERGWRHWREVRDELYRAHPQSPLPVERRVGFDGLPYFDYDPTLRVLGAVEPADASGVRSATSGEDRTRSRASRGRGSSSAERRRRSTCSGSRGTAVGSSSRLPTRRAGRRRTARAATCSTPSRARTSASATGGSCSTSTSPTTRRARTTRAGLVHSRRPRTGSRAVRRRALQRQVDRGRDEQQREVEQ